MPTAWWLFGYTWALTIGQLYTFQSCYLSDTTLMALRSPDKHNKSLKVNRAKKKKKKKKETAHLSGSVLEHHGVRNEKKPQTRLPQCHMWSLDVLFFHNSG